MLRDPGIDQGYAPVRPASHCLDLPALIPGSPGKGQGGLLVQHRCVFVRNGEEDLRDHGLVRALQRFHAGQNRIVLRDAPGSKGRQHMPAGLLRIGKRGEGFSPRGGDLLPAVGVGHAQQLPHLPVGIPRQLFLPGAPFRGQQPPGGRVASGLILRGDAAHLRRDPVPVQAFRLPAQLPRPRPDISRGKTGALKAGLAVKAGQDQQQ